jgi:hypothetical protein
LEVAGDGLAFPAPSIVGFVAEYSDSEPAICFDASVDDFGQYARPDARYGANADDTRRQAASPTAMDLGWRGNVLESLVS